MRVFESVAANAKASVSDKPQIVVATAGVEPLAEKGYAAVVILDVRIALGRDTLNAEEDAIRSWVNAIALGSTDYHSALIGIPADLGAKISTWQLSTLAKQELVQRREFGFPPVARVASATGAKSLLLALQDELSSLEQVRVLGLSKLADRNSTTGEHRLVFTFAYGASAEVVPLLAAFSLKSSGQLRTTSSGRNRRPLTIKLDDSRVL
jgi:primosomal protein N' (replication factor Y)